MLFRHCKTCRNLLQADDTHTEVNPTLTLCSAGLIARRASVSVLPLRSRSAVFSESDSAPCALPFSFSQGSVRKNSGQMILAAGDKRAHVGSMPACLAVIAEREHSSALFTQRDQRPSTVSDMISFGVSDGEIDDRFYFYFFGGFGRGGVFRVCD